MMCYRDMSFCSSSSICANTRCDRNFSVEVRAAAERWWNPTGDPEKKDGAPIGMMDFKRNCDVFIEKELADEKE